MTSAPENERVTQNLRPLGDPPPLLNCFVCGRPSKTWEIRQQLVLCEPCIYEEGQPYCSRCGVTTDPWDGPERPLVCGACRADTQVPRASNSRTPKTFPEVMDEFWAEHNAPRERP